MKRILVLCTGNSCRSQMAEGYLKYYSSGNLEVYSAGTEGTGLHPLTVSVMEEDNIDMSDHESTKLEQFRGQFFDYLITVCQEVDKETLKDLSYRYKIHFNIPDPASKTGTPQEVEQEFFRVRELVKKNMLKFLGGILSERAELA